MRESEGGGEGEGEGGHGGEERALHERGQFMATSPWVCWVGPRRARGGDHKKRRKLKKKMQKSIRHLRFPRGPPP